MGIRQGIAAGICAIVFTSGAQSAQLTGKASTDSGRATFKSIIIGSTLQDVKSQQVPAFDKDAELEIAKAAPGQDWGCCFLTVMRSNNFSNERTNELTIAGIPADYPTRLCFAKDGSDLKLASIEVNPSVLGLEDIRDSLTARYGLPKQEAAIMQNGFGAKFESKSYLWTVGTDEIKLRQAGNSRNRCQVVFSNPALMTKFKQAQAIGRAARGLSDL